MAAAILILAGKKNGQTITRVTEGFRMADYFTETPEGG
jgi:hypothetical protein